MSRFNFFPENNKGYEVKRHKSLSPGCLILKQEINKRQWRTFFFLKILMRVLPGRQWT